MLFTLSLAASAAACAFALAAACGERRTGLRCFDSAAAFLIIVSCWRCSFCNAFASPSFWFLSCLMRSCVTLFRKRRVDKFDFLPLPLPLAF